MYIIFNKPKLKLLDKISNLFKFDPRINALSHDRKRHIHDSIFRTELLYANKYISYDEYIDLAYTIMAIEHFYVFSIKKCSPMNSYSHYKMFTFFPLPERLPSKLTTIIGTVNYLDSEYLTHVPYVDIYPFLIKINKYIQI